MEAMLNACIIYVLGLCAAALEFAALKSLADLWLEQKKGTRFVFLGVLFVVVTLTASVLMPDQPLWLQYLLMLIVLNVVYKVGYAATVQRKILLSVAACVLLDLFDFVYLKLLMEMSRIDMVSVTDNPVSHIIAILSSKLSLFMVLLLCRYCFKKDTLVRPESKPYLYLSLAFPLLSLVTLLVLFFLMFAYHISAYWIGLKVFAVVSGNLMVLYLLERLREAHVTRQQRLLLEQRLKLELEHLESMKRLYTEQRRLTHDFNSHLLAIHSLAKAANAHDICRYISALLCDTTNCLNMIETNHTTVDAVLNQKFFKAKQQGISMRFEIGDLSELPISVNDIVIILSNLLDNAITAAANTQKKVIKLKLMYYNGEVVLAVRNTSLPVEVINYQQICVQKHSMAHGYGLGNIKMALSHYPHLYAIHYAEGWFEVAVVIQTECAESNLEHSQVECVSVEGYV